MLVCIVTRLPSVADSEPVDEWLTSAEFAFDDEVIGNHNGFNTRHVIPASLLTASGTAVRITLAAAVLQGATIDGCYIGHQAVAADEYDFNGLQAQVTFNSGSTSVTVPANGTVLSDEILFDLDETKNLIVAFHFSATSRFKAMASTGCAMWLKSAANETDTTDVTGYSETPDTAGFVQKIEVI